MYHFFQRCDFLWHFYLHQSEFGADVVDPEFGQAVDLDFAKVHGVHGEGVPHVRNGHWVWNGSPGQTDGVFLLVMLQDGSDLIAQLLLPLRQFLGIFICR